MSQRGRDSGPRDNDPDGDDAVRERAPGSQSGPLTGARPIEPYDPYRRRSDEPARPPTRNVAAESVLEPGRRTARSAGGAPSLPDDDPLSAEAWQLEIDELAAIDDDDIAAVPELEPGTLPPPRPPRRQASPPRGDRDAAAPAARGRRPRSSPSTRPRVSRPAVTIAVPRVVAGSSLVADRGALVLLGINAASVVLMALLLGVRIGGIPAPAVLQLDAAGGPALWGPPSVLWRLPVMSFFITLIFLAVAWFLHPIDRVAARFALGSAMLAQLVAWVAVIQHLS